MRAFGLATLAGIAYFLGFIGFGIWPLVFVFPALLLAALEGASPRRAFLLGAWTGFVALCGGYYWVVQLLIQFAGLAWPLAVLGYVLLNLFQGALWGVAAALTAWVRDRGRIAPEWALIPAVVIAERFYPLIFPSYVAASFFEVPYLTQTADLGGVLLVDATIMLVGGGLYRAVRARNLSARPLVVAGAVLAFTLLYSVARISMVNAELDTLPKLRVGLIQSNLGAADKTTRRKEFLRRHQQMSRAAVVADPGIELLVWPEAAFNRAIHRARKSVRFDITKDIPRPVLSGALSIGEVDEERRVYNSAVLTSSTGDIRGWYDKIYLVAFGETLPLSDTFPALKKWFPRTGTFDRGQSYQSLRLDDGTKLLPMICFEDLIGQLVRDIWNADGPPAALVNVTNDSWYGDTHEPRIHLALAALRSIESRRSLIRSTNTGISAVIDPAGRVIDQTGQWKQEILIADVPLVTDGRSTLYILLGNWVVWVSAAFILGLVVWRRRTP